MAHKYHRVPSRRQLGRIYCHTTMGVTGPQEANDVAGDRHVQMKDLCRAVAGACCRCCDAWRTLLSLDAASVSSVLTSSGNQNCEIKPNRCVRSLHPHTPVTPEQACLCQPLSRIHQDKLPKFLILQSFARMHWPFTTHYLIVKIKEVRVLLPNISFRVRNQLPYVSVVRQGKTHLTSVPSDKE